MSKHLLKEITSKIGSGATPTGGKDAYKGGDYSLIRSQNVLDMSFLREGLVYINDEQAKKLDGVKVESGDVLFNITGDSICRCCIVPDDILPARVNQHVAIIRPKSVNSAYLMYYLQYLKPYLMSICGNGSSRNALTKDSLEKLEIEISPFSNSIAEILSSLDKKIINNKRITSELESFAKTIYDYWFLQFEFPNEEGKPYKSSGGKMVWCEELKREIPEGWDHGSLYDIADFVNGLACQKYRPIDSSAKLPVIKIGEMHSGIGKDVEWARNDVPQKYIISDGDILFSWSATLETMIWASGEGVLNQHIFKVNPKKANKYYVYQQLKSYVINFIRMAETRKTTMGHITTDHLKQSRIVIPPSSIIEKYEEQVCDMFQKYIECSKENRELSSLRDFLLPMLMNGQVTFKDN